jgi:hypothetical protein
MLRSSVWSHVGTLGPVPVSGDARSKVNRGQVTHHPVRGHCGPGYCGPGPVPDDERLGPGAGVVPATGRSPGITHG